MSLIAGWGDILQSLEEQRKKYGGTSIGDSMALTVTGKGFRFPDEATANNIIRRFEERRNSMERRKFLISQIRLYLSRQFSEDEVSGRYSGRALDSLQALDQLNESALEYTQKYIEKIRKVKEKKFAEEDELSETANRVYRAEH